MPINKDFELTTLDFLLFNSDCGVCTRIDKFSNSEPDKLVTEFELLDKIILTNNIDNEPDFKTIGEKFLYWGCGYVKKQLMTDSCISRAREIIDHLETIQDLLPVNSKCLTESLFDENSLKLIFKKMEINLKTHIRDYIIILSKIWIFCEKEVKNSEVMCSALVCAYEMMKSVYSNDYLPDIFKYVDNLLTKYLRQINAKINNKSVIHYLLTLVKVVVRSESHAICRMNFWWRLICSIRADMMCSWLFDPCVVPFLANLYGKYISLDATEKFPYSVYTYNVFTNYPEFGSLCNHVMMQFLRLIGQSVCQTLNRKSNYERISHWGPFIDILLTEQHLNLLIISFYYWCQSIRLNTAKSAPSDIQLLESIVNCFSDRFIGQCLIKQQIICKEELDDKKPIPTLYFVIERILDLKAKLEAEELNKSQTLKFLDSVKISKSIIDILLKLVNDSSFILIGTKISLRIFCDCLDTMKKFALSEQVIGIQKSKCIQWVDSCKEIIGLIFPINCSSFSMIMSNDMKMFTESWFNGWINNIDLKLDRNVAICNLQCWIHLSCKISQRLDKDSFTVYSDDSGFCIDLIPFTEYLVAPLMFLIDINDNSITKSDYEDLWKIWEYLYIDIITKASILPDFEPLSWYKSIIKLLMKVLIKLTNLNKNPSTKHSIILNMICRSLRLVAIRIEENENINKKHPLWLLLSRFCVNFPVFSVDNIRVTYKEPSNNSDRNSGLFDDLVEIPTGKWAKVKFPFVNKFNCDLESNFDTCLSLISVLIYKISHSKSMMLDIVEILVPKIVSLSDLLVGRKLNTENLRPHVRSRNRANYDNNISQFENFIINFINRMQLCCFQEKLTTDILNKISPFLILFFSNENGIFSRSTIQNGLNFWNDNIGIVENLEYSQELLKIIKKLKLNNKVIIPQDIEEKIKDINVSFELINQDSGSLSEESKTPESGSILNKMRFSETMNSEKSFVNNFTPKKSLSNKTTPNPVLENQDSPNEPLINQIKSLTPVKKEIQTKEFSSPINEVLKRNTRKRTAYDLLRKSSDANYVVIAPQKNKRIRLTDHQKEILNEKKDEYKPMLYTESGAVPMKFGLVTQESVMSLASEDSLLNQINLTEEMSNDKNNFKLLKQLEETVDKNTGCASNEEPVVKPLVSVDIDVEFSENHSQIEDLNEENKENSLENPCELETYSTKLQKRLSEENAKNLSVILDKYPIDELKQYNQKIQESPVKLINGASKTNFTSSIFDSPVLKPNHQSSFHTIGPKKLLTPSNSACSPLANKFSFRTQRVVQLAIENKNKRDSFPRPPVISAPNTDELNKQPKSIIRHFWSERKKDAHVSFDLSNQAQIVEKDESMVTTNDVIITVNEEVSNTSQVEEPKVVENSQLNEAYKQSEDDNDNNKGVFLSPIPKRIDIPLSHMIDITSDLNNFTSQPQSIEETRQSLKDIVDQFSPIKDLSYSIVEETVDSVKRALNIASTENKKEIIRQLLSLIATNF